MDVKLDSLIEKIRKEGIEDAQQKADEIISDAKKQAVTVLDDAKKESAKIVEDGKRQADQFQQNAIADLRQAVRNAELLLKEKIDGLFDNVFKKEVAAVLRPNFLNELVTNILDNWAKNGDTEIVLNEKDKQELENLLFSGLKKELQDSVTIKVSPDVSNGFRIGLKGEQVYYDFSDAAIAEVLKSLINPRLKEILEKQNG
ncbi:hypothetical protein ISS22_00575 [candidate division KSB1 bacterium]|nr:hypothetical protein [candidate division KSB1 bacterium]